MFNPDEIPQIRESIRGCAESDKSILENLRKEVHHLKSNVRVIKPRSTTSVALVASDGGNNKLTYDPFCFQLVRVVDSYGKRLCLETISPSTDTDELSKRQFDNDGEPITALGILMRDLKVSKLYELSPMIPRPEKIKNSPDEVSKAWVLTYRDLWEWAVLYHRICYVPFATNTLLVRDGLLRSKIFSYLKGTPLFMEMMNNIIRSIDEINKRDNLKIFLVGVAKHSQVLARYSLVMNLENVFPTGEPRYAQVPQEIEEKSYSWKEFIWRPDGGDGELNKFSMGKLYLVRFGKQSSDPVWAVDILPTQINSDSEIFGYLLADATDGFPVPYYPMCLQKAHEHAQVVGFDMDILQKEVIDSIKGLLPKEDTEVIDHQVFKTDQSLKRYE